MRLLFVLGFAAACSSSGGDAKQIAAVNAGAGGDEPESGSAIPIAGAPMTTGGSITSVAEAGEAGAPGLKGVGGGDDKSAGGAGGEAGAPDILDGHAGHGGQAPGPPSTAGAGGETKADSSYGGEAGAATTEQPTCVCSSGPCCDGCQYRPKSHFCGETIRDSWCSTDTRITQDYWNLFCNADSSDCTRWAVHTKYVDAECPNGGTCVEGEIASCN
jgi:hypothetical protein